MSSFEGASETVKCFWESLLFTENCTEETRKSKTRETLCTHVIKFSSLKDFPKQIRIKRKYLKSRDDDVREKLRKIEFCADVRSTPKILPDARRRKET